MFANKRKLILISLIALVLIISAGTIYFIHYLNNKKIGISKPSVSGDPPYKTEEERQQCEKNFVLTDDKIKWALETKNPEFNAEGPVFSGSTIIASLSSYFSCKAAISGKYTDCGSPINSENKNKDLEDLEKNAQLVCYKTVWYEDVFLRLTRDKNVSDSVLADFNEYINKYAPDNSNLKKGLTEKIIKADDFLAGLAQKSGNVCQEPGKKSCQAALTRDESYCQGLTDEKESCISGAQFMKALDSGDSSKCQVIQDKDNVLPQVCRYVLNQDPAYCVSKDVIGNFAHQYCYFGHLQ
ncbi:MAG: hypothetical protein QMD77_00750 [Patescibacteria group bacterium]|nr:hypothetical protein [Patescibacteria group bacterium]